MKILRISGRNIASLYGEFHVDFAVDPIASAGLFAVVGPTGAGKTTLFDAMCLALYGVTPRIDGRGGPEIGRPEDPDERRIGSTDARSLVSRGRKDALAQVEYQAKDGHTYRATWEIRARPRAKAIGKPEMVLRRLDEEKSTATGLMPCREKNQALVGFSFQEFCRAVVLPQGDFAAFLTAAEDERAKLLEKITGSAIYSTIGELASKRLSEAKAELKATADQLAKITVLPDEDRAAAEAKSKAADEVAQAAADAVAELARARAWHDKHSKLAGSLAEAQAAQTQAKGEVEASKDRAQEVQAIKVAHGMRSAFDAAESAATALATRVQKEKDDRAQLEAVRADREKARGELEAAKAALEAAEGKLKALKPQIDGARLLDGKLGEATKELQDTEKEHGTAKGLLEDAKKRHEAASSEKDASDKARGEAEAWLAEHAQEKELASTWEATSKSLANFDEAAKKRIEQEKVSAGLAEDLKDAVAKHEALAGEIADQSVKIDETTKQRDEAEAAAKGFDGKAISDRLKTLRDRREALDKLETLRVAHDETAAGLAEHVAKRDDAAKKLELLGAELGEHAEARKFLEEEKKVAKGVLEFAQETADLGDRRHHLRDGAPCPLCGSTEHPYSKEAPAESALKKAEKAYEKVKERLHEVEQKEQKARTGQAAHTQSLKSATEGAAKAEAKLAQVATEWSRRAAAVGVELGAAAASPVGAEAPLMDALDAVAKGIDATEKDDAENKRLDKRIKALTKEIERLRDERRAQEEKKEKALARRTDLAAKHKEAESAATTARERCDGIVTSLDARLRWMPDWPKALRDDPKKFRKRCEDLVREYAKVRDEAEKLKGGLGALEKTLGEAKVLLEEKKKGFEEADRALSRRKQELETLRDQRRGLLGGRPAGEVEREAEEAAKGAKSKMDSARDAEAGRAREAAKLGGAIDEAARQIAQARAEVEASEAKLVARMAEVGVDRETLRKRLDVSPEEIAKVEEALAELAKAVTRATTACEERQKALADHSATGRPAVEAANLDDEEKKAVAAKADADKEAKEARAPVDADVAAHVARDSLGPEQQAKQQAHDRWKRIAEAIGGSSFRNFAQGLELSALLVEANRHLKDIAPRYRLMRVPGRDLEVQVEDLDLGGEVRGVNSLSGGETFLVSLGLALGLSSIAARSTAIETLFIDEGFGTLDADTLGQAMSVLEGLRASGRTVGIISHVAELHERIGVLVKVERTGVGRSTVRTVRAGEAGAGG